MSEAESPIRRAPGRTVTVDDVRELLGASTPHFALQVRNRLARLVAGLDADDPARVLAEREIARLTQLGFTGETRGAAADADLAPLASVGGARGVAEPGPSTAAPHPTAAQADRDFPGVGGA